MYETIIVGGTFDILHKGHEKLLLTAFSVAQQVVIGLTTDAFVKTYKSAKVTPFIIRQDNLTKFLQNHGYSGKFIIHPIDDPYEPAASGDYDAIMVTEETQKRAEQINDIRASRGLPVLVLVDQPYVKATDGQPISSTRVRNGQIDQSGNLVMPEKMRLELGIPLGQIIPAQSISAHLKSRPSQIVVTIGDMTTKIVRDLGINPSLSIIDLMVRRKPYLSMADFHFNSISRVINVASGPGFISGDAQQAITDWSVDLNASKLPYVIVVSGEEDLLVLPAITAAPIGAMIYYGQPSNSSGEAGLVAVEVTQAKKQEVAEILKQFI
jgi:pantetheine-phosphate adenylyltransferase